MTTLSTKGRAGRHRPARLCAEKLLPDARGRLNGSAISRAIYTVRKTARGKIQHILHGFTSIKPVFADRVRTINSRGELSRQCSFFELLIKLMKLFYYYSSQCGSCKRMKKSMRLLSVGFAEKMPFRKTWLHAG